MVIPSPRGPVLRRLARYFGFQSPRLRSALTAVPLWAGVIAVVLEAASLAIREGSPKAPTFTGFYAYALLGVFAAISVLAGLGHHFLAHWYLKSRESRVPTVREFFNSQPQARLTGLCLGMICRSVAEESAIIPADAATIRSIAKRFERDWPLISKSPSAQTWFTGIQDASLVGFIRDPRKPAIFSSCLTPTAEGPRSAITPNPV